MESVQFALVRPLFSIGLVFVVNTHLNDVGTETKAAPKGACPASWKLSGQYKALVVGLFGESFKFND